MANSDAATPPKPGKTSSVVQEQSAVHPYPDWPAMQAYYGSGVAMPPPYFAANVTQAHSPHPYMWPSPIMMPPFGAPYSMYQHAGVYAQPPDATEGNAAVPSSTEAKTGGGVATPIKPSHNGGDENEFGSVADVTSHSESDGRDSSNGRKKKNGYHTLENSAARNTSKAENSMMLAATTNPKPLILAHPEERESKKEKRKQSNRESARRSRLRKQAETEDLAQKVDLLTAENQALRSEVSQLSKDSARLRLENSALQEKLRETQMDTASGNSASAVTENLLSRISSSTFAGGIKETEKERENESRDVISR